MPFSVADFFDIFRTYNTALWPAIVLAWLSAAVLFVKLIRGRPAVTALRVLSIAQWSWIGIVFHAGFFASINPAAWLFAFMFIIHAVMLTANHVGIQPLVYTWKWDRRHALAGVLMGYALIYPGLSAIGGTWPAVPLFLVPCPLLIFETGLLLTSERRVPSRLLVVPILWALVGGSAALFFRVLPDLMLFACGGLLLAIGLRRPTAYAQSASPVRMPAGLTRSE